MQRKQRGATLVVAIIFMSLVALIGVSIALNTTAEERQTRNFRDRNLAQLGAEAALRDAELYISGSWTWPYASRTLFVDNFTSTCTDGLCDSVLAPANGNPQDSVDFFAKPAAGSGVDDSAIVIGTYTGSPTFSNSLLNPPRYRIEVVGTVLGNVGQPTSQKAYRITAQAEGQIATTRVILQEFYLPPNSTN